MAIVTKTLDAIYLGEFGDMSLGFPTGNGFREDLAGSYNADGGTLTELTFRGNESFADRPNLFDNDFYVNRDDTIDGIAEGGGALQPVTYIHQNTLVTFQTATGGFTANMNFFQLEDGSVYMMPNPQESPTSSFRYEVASAGQEVTGWSVPLLDGTDNGFPPMEGDWAGTTFPDPNEAPTANNDSATVIEGDSVTVNVLSNDTDPEGGDLDIQGTPTAANGTVTVNNETGEITYTPNAGFTGTDTITYTAVDEGGLTDDATLTITVEPNPGPDLNPDPGTVINDICAFYLGNDLTNISGLSNQTFSPDGSVGKTVEEVGFIYQAKQLVDNPNFPVSVFDNDREVFENVDTWVSHDVAGGSNNPNQEQDPVQVERVVVTFTTPDGDIPANMWVMLLEDGTLHMVPDHPSTGGFADYEETVQGKEILSFTIGTVTGNSSEAMTPPLEKWTGGAFPEDPNEAPTANDDFATVIDGDSVTINVLSNDTDPEGGDLDILGTPTAANGTVTVNNETGEITYTPDPGFSGTDTITYTIVDEGGLTDTATLTVTVEPAGPTPNQIVDGENTGEIMDPGYDDSLGATNSGGDIIDGPDGLNDTILGNGGNDAIDAGLGNDEVYGGSGNDLIEGGAGSDTLTGDFASDVTDVVVDSGTVNGDDTIFGGAGDDVIYGDSGEGPTDVGIRTFDFRDGRTQDLGDTTVRVQTTGDVGNGDGRTPFTVNISELPPEWNPDGATFSDGSFRVDNFGIRDEFGRVIDGSSTYIWTYSEPVEGFSMVVSQIDDGDNVGIFARGPDGQPVELFYTAGSSLDPIGTGPGVSVVSTSNGTAIGNPDTTLTVWANEPVSRIDFGLSGQHEVYIAGPSFGPAVGFEPVDAEGGDDQIIGGEGADVMFGEGGDDTFLVGSAAEGAGDVITGGNGPDQTTDNDVLDLRGAGAVTITATDDATDTGAQTGTVTFADGSTLEFSQIETILTDPTNEAPVANDDAITVDEDGEVTFDPTANDTDPDGDPLTVDSFTQPANGTVTQNPDGTLTYTPDPDYNGPDSFEVTVTDPDGLTSTSTVDVTVAPVNDAPIAADDTQETPEDTPVVLDLLANDSDPDGDALTVIAASVPADQGTVELVNGVVTFTPAEDFNGDATITYTVEDEGGLTDTATHTVSVTPVNDAPVAVDDTATTDEDTPVTINVLANDSDPENDPLTVVDATVPADQGTVAIIGNQVVFTPAPDFNGEATISYTVEDPDGLQDTAVVTVDVTPVDDAPVAEDDTATTEEDTPVTINVLANDTDPQNDPLTVTDATVPADQGTVAIIGNQVVFTPAEDFTGEATITYTVEDPSGNADTAEVVVDVTPVNDAPVAVDDTATTDEDTPVTINVLANDSDPENDPLTVVDATVPADQGTVAIIGNQVVFTPADDFNGEATITYTIEDTNGLQDTAEVSVDVAPVDDAPVTEDDTATTDEDTPVTIDPLANDSDPDGQPLEILGTPTSPNGTVTVNPDGTIEFTPDPDFNGPTTIDYIAVDPDGNETPGQITVDVAPVDDAPVTEDDTATTDEDTPVTIDPLANDSDPDGQPLEILGTPTSPNGTVTVNPDGTIEFTPDPDFNGPTTIDYIAVDPDGNETPGQITVDVAPVDDAPVTEDDTATTDEDTPVTIDPLANDSDPDGQPLEILGTPTSPNGTVTVNPDGTIEFTPDPDFNGPTTIDYIAVDPDGNETPGQITVDVAPVNDAPDAVDDTVTTLEDEPVVIDVLANDEDPDGDDLTIVDATVPADQGTVAIVGGQLEFTPAPDFNGEATITYTVEDPDGLQDTAVVTVNVSPVEDAPVAVDDAVTTDEDTPVTIDVLANDTDPQDDPLTVTSATVPAEQGTVEIVGNEVVFTPAPDFNGDATITYTVEDPSGNADTGEVAVTVTPVEDAPVTVDDVAETDEDTPVTIDPLANDSDPDGQPLEILGTPTSPNGTVTVNPDGTIEFTPDPDFNGPTTIDYIAVDPDGNETPGQITVDVAPVDDAPVTEDDTATTDEDTPVTIDPLANDSDPDGQPLEILGTPTSPNGTVTVNPDGTIEFTPDPDFNGPTTIDYIAVDPDGNETPGQITVDVAPVNDAPDAVDDTVTTLEDEPVVIDVLANDEDPDGDDLTIVDATVPADQGTVAIVGGQLEFTPAPDFNGEATITYTVEDPDGLQDTAVVTVNVSPVEDAPVAVDDAVTTDEDTPVTIDVLANDTDPQDDPLTVTSATVPAEQGTVEIVGNEVVFTPAPDFNGDATITYTVEDPSGNADTGEVAVTVTPVEDAPVTVDDVAETDEDTPVTIDPLANDSDPDGQPLEILGTPTSPNGTVTVNPDGTIEFTPDPDFNGPTTIDYIAVDPDGNETPGQITVDVAPVDDAPVTEDDTATTDEDTPVTIDPLANDSDPDGQPLEILGTPTSPNGTVTVNPDGTIEFTPDPDFNGPTTIDYIAVDPDGNETPGQITVDVAPVNDAPDAVDDTVTTLEDEPVVIDVLANDEDPDGDDLTIVDATVPADQGTVAIVGGQLEFTPAPDFNGEATITYTVEDPDGLQDTAVVTVNVSPVEDAPVAVDDAVTTDEDTPVTIDVLANDTDPQDDPLTVTSATVPAEQGTVEIVGNEVVFTPAPDFNGDATITYTVEDPSGNADTGEVAVTVTPVEDAPVTVDDVAETDEDTPVTIDPLANDSDPDGQPLEILGTPTSPNGTVTVNPDGTIEFTPDPDFNGPTTIDYIAVDPDGNETPGQITVDVAPVDDAPVTEDDTATTDEDTPVTIDPLANDSDPDGQPLEILGTPTSPNGTVTVNPDGTIEFTPDPDFNGPTTIDYIAVDPDGNETPGQITVDVAPVNDAPDAVDDTVTTLEDEPVVIDVLANDEDPDGDDLTIVDATVPADQGTVAIVGGQLEFTPAPDFNGEATITYTVEDPDGLQDTAVVTVNVSPVEDAPVAVDDAVTTDEDTPVTIDVLANDTDPQDDPLTVTSATVPAEQGTVEIVGNEVVFTPAPDFNGDATITYTVEDPSGNADTGEVAVTVTPVEDAPVTVDDVAETDEDTPVTIDPLANDSDPDGQPLEILGTPTSPNGTVTVNPDGTIEFTPDPDFNGPTTIDYIAVDPDGNETPGQITVDVAPVDDAPVTEDDTATTDEDTPVTIDPLANDSDPDGQPLEILGTPTSPNGTVTVNPDGTIEFTPDPDFNGPTTIDYIAVDPDGNETPGQITVDVAPVNDAPDAVDDTVTTLEDEPVVIDVLANDEDPDGDDLTIVDATVPADQGTVAIVGGQLEFTPAPDFNGEATITYTVEDPDGLQDTAVVTVNVSPVEDAPVAVDDAVTTDEDTPVTIDVLANDTDPQDDPLTVTSATVPAEQGTVEIVGNEVVFTPAPDFNGDATITYTVEDPSGNADTGEVAVTVTPVEDAPVTVDDVAETDEDTPVTIDPLANDSDPDGQPLEILGTPTSPNGTVTVNPDGTIEFTPDPDFNGPTTIDYIAVDPDGNETPGQITVDVAPVDDAPVTEDDTATTDEDTPVTIDPLANDSDPDGQPLEILGTPTSPNGTVTVNPDGTIEFTPDPDFNGPTTIDYIAVDPDGNETPGQITVDVAPVNDAPDAVDDTVTTLEDEPVVIDVLANDEDPDGDDLTIVDATVPADQGTVAIVGGQLEFTPAPDFNGEATITYTVEDPDGLQDTAVVTVNVSPVEDAPVAVDDAVTTDEDTPVTIDVLANDTDPQDDPLTVTSATVPAEQGTVEIVGNEVVFTPAPDFNGDATITYTVEDPSGNADTGEVAVTVTPVEDAPVTVDDVAETDEDTPVTIDPLANDSDPDGQPLEILGTPTSPNGTVTVNPDGTIEFTPDPDFNGPTTIDYIAVDPDGNETPGQITVDVAPVDDAPDAVDDRATTDFGTPVTIDVLGNDTDAENTPLTITDATVPVAQGTVAIVAGELVFTPADGFEGDATISYTVSDGDLTDTADVVVTVGDNPADGVVDGAEDGEVMDPGYTDPQGDQIDGDDGIDDTINGNGGDDDIDAGLGDDTVSGGTGDDTIDGNVGNDTLFGEEGEDTIDGGDGDDVIDGGDDNDVITGGAGNDTVEGGDGDDIIDTSNPDGDAAPDVGYPSQPSATIPGLVFPGYDADTDPNDDKDIVSGGAGNDTIITGDDDDVIDGGIGDDTISAGFDDDSVSGGDGNDFIEGGEGNDFVDGGSGDDIIYGGLEDPLADAVSFPDDETDAAGFQDLVPENNGDVLFGGDGNDTLYGQDDDDSLFGEAGNDLLLGGVDDDLLDGGDDDDTLIGGQGADEMLGGLGNDRFVIDAVGDGTDDVVVGGEDPDGNDNDVLDLTGSGVSSISYTDGDPATESGVVTFTDGGTLTFSEIETVIPCFTPGALIATSNGQRLVEELQPGDRIITRDNGFQEIAWVGAKQMSGLELAQRPNLRPVFVKAGSLGNGLPERDMMLSPNHKVLFASDQAELYFEEREVLVAAKHLIGKPGIQQVDVTQTTYIHFMFERHEVVLSDGAWTESFHPGDHSINGIDEEARNEILALFPELATDRGLKDYRLARTELKKHEARLLIS